MERTCLYRFFLLLIAFALKVDSNESGFPPPGYRDWCLVVVEAYKYNGIYRYDPLELVDNGIPSMVKLEITPGEPVDYNMVDRQRRMVYGAPIFLEKAIWFPGFPSFRLPFNSKHPCSTDTGDQIFWNIVKWRIGAHVEGYLQVTNGIVNVECVPRHGLLTTGIEYNLPVYDDGYKTAYSCVTWLREVEESSGVLSHATAAEVDPVTKKCTLFYESYSDLIETNGDNNYCFLKETVAIPTYPGFYKYCRIYVEDPLFAGLWELDLTSQSNWMPFLRRRRATMDDPSSVEVTLHEGFDGTTAIYENGHLLFRLGGKVRLKIPLRWHICIGPDTTQYALKETKGELRTVYRNDKGLDCIPFYDSSSYDSSFLGFTSVTLGVYHTLGSCTEYLKAEFPFAQWKVVVSTLDVGPCVAFGGGVEYSSITRPYSKNTYSCFSTKFHVNIDPAPSCLYGVEAGMYSGNYSVDSNWENDGSQFRSFTRVYKNDTPNAALKWENGYKLTGLYKEYLVGLPDNNICQEDIQAASVTFNDEVVGIIYRSDGADVCEPYNKAMLVPYGYFAQTETYSDVASLAECKAQAKTRRPTIRWKAFFRMGSDCEAYGERLDVSHTVSEEWGSDTYSCVNEKNSDVSRLSFEKGCTVSVEGLTEYCGKYSMDRTYENNYGSYPIMKRNTIIIENGRIIEKESNAFIKTEYTPDGLVVTLFGQSVDYKILASKSHMCEPSHAYGAKFWIVGETETETPTGYVYKFDPDADSCESLPGIWKPRGDDPTASVSEDVSFADCLKRITTDFPGTTWKELAKTDRSCKAWDDSLDTRDVTRRRQKYRNNEKEEFKPGCTCVFTDRYFPTPRISDVNPDCMAIVIDPVLHGLYAVQYREGEILKDFPLVVAKKIVLNDRTNSLTVGRFFKPLQRMYRYIEYNPLNDKQKLEAKNGETRDIISEDGFLCFGDYQEPEPVYHVKKDRPQGYQWISPSYTTGNVQRYSGNFSCEIVDPTNAAQTTIVRKQRVECLTEHVICSYGQSNEQKMVTCLSKSKPRTKQGEKSYQ